MPYDPQWSLPVVIDVGTSFTKAGFGGCLDAVVSIPTAVNHANTKSDSCESRVEGDLTYPLKNGIVVNWSEYEQLMDECFHERLAVDSSQHPVLLTEPPLNPPENRETLAEIMFETFQVPKLHIGIQAVLALYGKHALKQLQNNGHNIFEISTMDLTGTVIDSGDGVTHVVPIVNGYVVGPAIQSMALAGSTITSFIEDKLAARGEKLPADKKIQICRGIKEKHCYVCKNVDRELQKLKDAKVGSCTEIEHFVQDKKLNKQWKLPIREEQFQAPELFFNPRFGGLEVPPLQELVDQAILRCPIDARRKLYNSIWLSGGSTLFRSFARRLQMEVQNLVNRRLSKLSTPVQVTVSKHPRQRLAVWVGGSLLSKSDLFVRNCHSKQDYEEYGPAVCRRSHITME